MSNKDLEDAPHDLKKRDDAWWYEEKGGICVVVERKGWDDTTQIWLPWRSIRSALARKDKP